MLAASALLAVRLSAQGSTTAALQGAVERDDSTGIEDAVITLINASDGERRETATRAHGRYAFEYVPVGGSYSIVVRSIGFAPDSQSGVSLSLGERRQIDFTLRPAVLRLEPVRVIAGPDSPLRLGQTGPVQTVTAATSSHLPVARRDFSQLALLSPQAVLSRDSGITFAGQSDRLNNLQIDGASNNDLGGVRGPLGFGTPGSSTGARTLSVEAIRELQILIAPFDVRYGNFAGGLVNAVTRSGSNRWEGSLSGYFEDAALTGKDVSGQRAADFSNKEIAVTVGGPIIRDHAAFFLDVGVQRYVGARGLFIGTDTTGGRDSMGIGVRRATIERFQNILRNTYQVDPGSIASPPSRNPAANALGKITLWPAVNQRIELSYNYAQGTSQEPPDGGPYALSSQSLERPSTNNATRLAWTTTGGRLSNELTVARQASQERCLTAARFPQVTVTVSPEPDYLELYGGSRNSCPERFADQTVWELTDNASWSVGSHVFTVGTHDELIHLDGYRRIRVPAGRWMVSGLDSLESGVADEYTRDIVAPGQPAAPVSDYGVRQLGLYAQDQWSPIPQLTLTAGLRFDVPFLPDAPAQNTQLLSALGVNTAQTPSGHLLWSPRLGFTYGIGSARKAVVRGGAGLFSGRPIYLYFSNVYEATGLDFLRIECTGDQVPAITLDPDNQPTRCLGGRNPQAFEVNYFNPAFRFPRNLRLSLGADVELPWGMVGTVDLLYIRGVDQLDLVDVNLAPPTRVSAGEGGRVLYGTIDENGIATANRLDPNFGVVAELRNSSGDRATSATAQLRKRLAGTSEVSLAYTYTDARDRMSADCFNLTCNLDFTPLDGTLENRRVTTSRFEARNKITLGAVMAMPLRLQLGVFYNGYTGQPYTYLVSGDANADESSSFDGNDIVYVPKNAADITLTDPSKYTLLDRIIEGDPCLRSQRGRIMARNSCRNHWITLLNARLSRQFAVGGARSVEVIADLFNVANLLNSHWGIRYAGSLAGDVPLLALRGYDQLHERGIYEVLTVDRTERDVDASRWRAQLGARYTF